MKEKYAEAAEEVDAEASEEAAVELREEVDTKAGPIRVDTKPDIVETEAELGTESRIHDLADCLILLGSRFNYGAKLQVRELQVGVCESGRKYMCPMVE